MPCPSGGSSAIAKRRRNRCLIAINCAGVGWLAEVLRERETQGEICLLGGTVMVLAFKARPATRDVDAIFQPVDLIREAADIVRARAGPA